MKTLAIIPVHNEAPNISRVLSEISSQKLFIDLLVVDDGSSDSSGEIAKQAGAKVLSLPFNLGYGAAVQTGFIYGAQKGYDIALLMDGDGQHDPKYIPDLLAPVLAGEADITLGTRFLGNSNYPISLGRKIGIYLFSKLTSYFTKQKITDPTSGFQAIGPQLMRFFVNDHYPYDYPDADTLIRLFFAGFRIKEVPVEIRPRLLGQSMHRGAKALYYLYKMVFSIFIVLTQKRKLKKESSHATCHQVANTSYQPFGANRHYPACSKESSG